MRKYKFSLLRVWRLAFCFHLFFIIGDIWADSASKTNLPPLISHGIGVAQIFDYNLTETQKKQLHREFVWGADEPWPGIYSAYYLMFDREPNRNKTTTWYQEKYPERIIYKCDTRTPADTFFYSFGTYAPLDIKNPKVREYIATNFLSRAIAKGYQGLAIDNVTSTNINQRCGIWSQGKWLRRYSGARVDPLFKADVIDYLEWIKAILHKSGLTLAVNLSFDPADILGYREVASVADIVVDESGFSRGCLPSSSGVDWINRFSELRRIAITKPLVIIDKTCKDIKDINKENIEWTLANYFLLRSNSTYLSISGMRGGGDQQLPFFALDLGREESGPIEIGSGFIRRYENGFVVVNPNLNTSLTLPINHNGAIQDFSGNRVGKIAHLKPVSGRIFLYK